jgi:autotransporter-associated beta strand protein
MNAFSSNSAYTVASGATLALAGFSQAIGSLTGAGAVTLGSATLTTGNDNTSTTFSGTISGTGGLAKTGTGTLTLSGASTYTGPTTVNAGSLVVNGSLASSVTVSGGTLGGNATFGGLTAGAGSVLAPGNSIGTFTVNGNFLQTGGVYQVEVSPQGQSDQIVASGTATISGGTVQVLAQSGTYARNTTYTILTTAGGVNGAYAGVTSNFAFLVPSLSYGANNVFLTLAQSQTAFASAAQTGNQYAVGSALDRANASATGDFNTVLNALSVLSTSQGPWALNQISGQPYADFGSLNVANNALFMNTLGQQMAVARGGAGSGQRVALAQACEIEACDGTSPLGVWGSMVGGLGSVQGNGSSQTFTYNVGGAAAGIDYRIDPRFLVGLGTSYTAGTQWVDSFMGKGWSNNVGIAAYGSFTDANVYVDGLAGYAYSNNQMQRYIVIPGLQPRQANASTGANQFLGQVETGYRVDVYAPAAATVTPFARFQAASINQAGFTEWGASSLNLSVAQQTTTSLRTTLGADLAGTIGPLALGLRLGWLHEYADVSRPMTAAFAGAPTASFTVYGATPQRDSAVLGFSAAAEVAAAMQLYLRYNGEVGAGFDNHTLNLGLRVSF